MDDKDKIRQLSERVRKLEEENSKLKQDSPDTVEEAGKASEKRFSRRGFLKMLGLGAGSLVISSTAAGISWSVIQPRNSGTSDVKAKTATEGAAPFTLQGNLEAKDGEVLWDENSTYIPRSSFQGLMAEEKGTDVASFTSINFGTGSYVLDDGDGTVSVNQFNRRDPRM